MQLRTTALKQSVVCKHALTRQRQLVTVLQVSTLDGQLGNSTLAVCPSPGLTSSLTRGAAGCLRWSTSSRHLCFFSSCRLHWKEDI